MSNTIKEKTYVDIYSRKQALADGVQVYCPDDIRREAGIKFPVYFTSTLWEHYIIPPADLEGEGQSIEGRLWDVLYMFTFNARVQRVSYSHMYYTVLFRMPSKRKPFAATKKITLYTVIGPTDFNDPSPAITIMLPGED